VRTILTALSRNNLNCLLTYLLIVLCSQTQKICLKQSVTCDMSLEAVPESDGRELTWIKNEGPDTGHYDMFMVRFKSKTVAANFRMAFVCARELLVLGLRAATAAATRTDAASPSSVSDPIRHKGQSTD